MNIRILLQIKTSEEYFLRLMFFHTKKYIFYERICLESVLTDSFSMSHCNPEGFFFTPAGGLGKLTCPQSTYSNKVAKFSPGVYL